MGGNAPAATHVGLPPGRGERVGLTERVLYTQTDGRTDEGENIVFAISFGLPETINKLKKVYNRVPTTSKSNGDR